jgi:excisionase family DNA binding protein
MANGAIEIQPNAVYRIRDVCEILKVSDVTLQRLVQSGEIRATRVGRVYRFLGRHLLEALELPPPRA